MALLLIAPLFLFLLGTFIMPLSGMLKLAVDDRETATLLSRTMSALKGWDKRTLPSDAAYEALVADLRQAQQDKTLGTIARRINYDTPGLRSLISNSARKLATSEAGNGTWQQRLTAIDPQWAKLEPWIAIERARGPVTDLYLLTALDLKRDAQGQIVQVDEGQSNYLDILGRTFGISLSVTLITLLLAFPVAQYMASASPRLGGIIMLLVLLPFWTSVLVRTMAWVVVLQGNGLVNNLLQTLGVIEDPLHMLYNRTGVLVALSHVLLPYMILPLYGAMRAVPAAQMRAAVSLGAGPVMAYRRVYLPQLLPGIAAGSLLVFILALGYYITPVLIGGSNDQLISYYIAFYTSGTINWGLAAGLGMVLLIATLVLYRVYVGLVGVQRIGR
ncbi:MULTISPECIES: ABC transporter permease [unclassified Pseudomonas]|jgi:putative spermidine/putrescine transport system permease protein|uniref:ABC transporter permease n=1 Tax=unclassified Pseudomonas TaxID=196821 RepID=UPI001CBFEA9B|nr:MULTISPECIES: ABC transporter permease [unclassified Pseudomonas]